MIILYSIILILAVVIFLLALVLYHFRKKYLSDYDKKLILFVIDMYLSYGETIDVFPNDNAKEILLEKIRELKRKIENDIINFKIKKEDT